MRAYNIINLYRPVVRVKWRVMDAIQGTRIIQYNIIYRAMSKGVKREHPLCFSKTYRRRAVKG